MSAYGNSILTPTNCSAGQWGNADLIDMQCHPQHPHSFELETWYNTIFLSFKVWLYLCYWCIILLICHFKSLIHHFKDVSFRTFLGVCLVFVSIKSRISLLERLVDFIIRESYMCRRLQRTNEGLLWCMLRCDRVCSIWMDSGQWTQVTEEITLNAILCRNTYVPRSTSTFMQKQTPLSSRDRGGGAVC